MIRLMSPPRPARRVLHLNSPSTSPGGKDYVLVELDNGELWAVNGTFIQVRNGGGAVQRPKKSWDEVVTEKTRRKNYSVVGEYRYGGPWWSPGRTSVYCDVPNIPITPTSPPPTPEPEPPPKVAPQPSRQAPTLADQYPVSDLAKSWDAGDNGEWFAVF